MSQDIRKIVFDNLARATECGSFEKDGQLYGMTAQEVAYDMACYASDCEFLAPKDLKPYVEEWFDIKEVMGRIGL